MLNQCLKIDNENLLFEEFCGKKIENIEYIDSPIKFLFESYGIFDSIYSDIDKITYIILDLIRKDGYNVEYTYNFKSESLHVDFLKITLHNNKMLAYNGTEHIEDNILYLELNIGVMIPHIDDETIFDVFNKYLENLLFHELTHAKNEVEQLLKNEYSGTPDWYDVVVKIIQTINDKSDSRYQFSMCLYFSYYGEVQAITAEIISILDNKIKYCNEWQSLNKKLKLEKIDEFLNEIQEYRSVRQITNYYIPLIKSYTRFDIDSIKNIFNKNGYTITDKKYSNFVKQIEFGNKRIISKIRRGLNYIFKKYKLC